MSGGVIAGIVVPLLLVPIAVVLVCLFVKKKKKANNQGGMNSAYTVYCEYRHKLRSGVPYIFKGRLNAGYSCSDAVLLSSKRSRTSITFFEL